MSSDTNLVVDARWQGDYGIGRFGREILPRLSLPSASYITSGSPTNPLDSALLGLKLRRKDSFYSPGFNAVLSQCRQLVTVYDLIHLQTDKPSRVHALYYEKVLKPAIVRSGTVITISEESAAHISEWLRPHRVKIVNMGSAISEVFSPLGGHFPRTERAPYLLYVGNMKDHKNPLTAIKTAYRMPEYDLLMVTQQSDKAHNLAAQNGMTGRVKILSSVSDAELADLYRGATALLMPSLNEGFGLPALEALCSGTGVVYWTGCGSIDSFAAKYGGGVSDPYDIDAWVYRTREVAGMQSQIDSSELRAAYSWDAVAHRVQEAIDAFL